MIILLILKSAKGIAATSSASSAQYHLCRNSKTDHVSNSVPKFDS